MEPSQHLGGSENQGYLILGSFFIRVPYFRKLPFELPGGHDLAPLGGEAKSSSSRPLLERLSFEGFRVQGLGFRV